MDDANFSGRHDNIDNSESAVDSVSKLKEYLISAIREWSRVLVGKDKSRENIWLPVHAPKWWLKSYPPWRNPTGKKKDTLEELRIKYNILQEKLLSEGRFPKRWVEQTNLYQNDRYQDLFLLTRLIKLSEELREKEQELKDISSETFKNSNFSAASVVECLVQSGVSIQSEVKKLQEKLGRNYPLGSESVNLSAEKSNNDSSSVLNDRQNNKATVLTCSKTSDINTTHFSLSAKALPANCIHTRNIPVPHSPISTITLNTQSSHASNTLLSRCPHTPTTQQKQSPHTTTPPTYYKTSHKRAVTESQTEIPLKIPKYNSHTALRLSTLHPNNPENNFISNLVEITKSDLLLDIPEADADDDSTSTNSDKNSILSPDESISSVDFISESDSSPVDHPLKITLHLNNNQYMQELHDFYEEDGTKHLLQYV